ncbi:MAG: redox-regulated ATPase YchF [Capsulimonadaceae bacterium]|nr:redox-regulated ATPase YchF [Capsulimonadaceae bacterium]
MKVGLIGLPGSGKTTLFHALTRGEGSPAGGGRDALVSVVPVPDKRYDFAVNLFNPKKRTPASIEFLDGAATIGSGDSGGGGKFGSDFFVGIRSVDALVQVVRAFESPLYDKAPDPAKEAAAISEELLLADLQVIENRLERIKKQLSTRKSGAVLPEQIEQEILLRLKATLDEFKPLRGVELTEEEKRITKNFDFLTAKPVIVIANIAEDDLANAQDLPLLKSLRETCAEENAPLVVLCAAAEREVSQLDDSEQAEFLDALGIEEPARDRLIRAAYQALGVMSFFTVGEDEVRAWTIPVGANAVTAAGRIHSDLARGFIRAEVMAFDDLIAAGSWDVAKAGGKLRLESKDYPVRDGDILHVRFKV